MVKLRFSKLIDAPKRKVWETMIGDKTYPLWTAEFGPGSHFVGSWSEGSKILFLAPEEKGDMGMVSRIKTNRPYDFISIEHLGIVKEGKEDTSSEEAKPWAGALEDYSFKDVDGKTEVVVDMDSDERYREMFERTWPRALQKLKDVAER